MASRKAEATKAAANAVFVPELVERPVARRIFAKLAKHHHDAHCELDHRNPFELLVATVLSAQSTDVMVNQVTPELFRRWPTPEALARADVAAVEKVLSRLGMYRQKTRNIIGLSRAIT